MAHTTTRASDMSEERVLLGRLGMAIRYGRPEPEIKQLKLEYDIAVARRKAAEATAAVELLERELEACVA